MVETVTYTIPERTEVVEIRDANGVGIFPGSILRSLEDGEVGVVVRICRAGESGPIASMEGDLDLILDHGHHRVTNRYDKWIHVPGESQTYKQRYRSWMYTPWSVEDSLMCKLEGVSKEEAFCIDAVMELLPDDVVDVEYGPWPDTFENVMKILSRHLSELSGQQTPLRGAPKEKIG